MKEKRTVIITGSSRGIGLAAAEAFVRSGDNVTIFCRHRNHVREAGSRLRKTGSAEQILETVGDVRRAQDANKIVRQALKRFGRLDVLVNNAGIAAYKPIEKTSEKLWDDILDTNLRGAFLFTKETLPVMRLQGSGMIINISSGLGLRTDSFYSAYSSSKFGMIGLTQVTAAETANQGIKCYAVLPGAVATRLHMDMHPWENPQSMMTPKHVGDKIFEAAKGRRRSGSSIKVYF